MHFLEELRWRGLLQDISDEQFLKELKPGSVFYTGIDPTAVSLQLGNLVPLVTAIRLARAGLKPLILMGGATGAIGDPSGKDSERKLLTLETLEKHVALQTEQVKKLFARHAADVDVEFVNNYTWTEPVSILEFLRDVGKHFTVNYMQAKESVKNRLEGQGMSFTEFSYQLLQAFDFYHLHTHNNCVLQIGGSDQWGNMTSGLELIRRKAAGPAAAFSIPLVTNAQGKKFGKSEQGALWLDAELTSPYTLHQFLLNTDDKDVISYLKIFTFLSEEEISSLEAKLKIEPEARVAQKMLADKLVSFVHGDAALEEAKRSAEVLFGGSISGISDSQLLSIFKDVPSKEIAASELDSMQVPDLFVAAGALKSKGEARRLIQNGGAYINNRRIEGADEAIPRDRSVLILRTGKKAYYLVKIS